MTHALHLPLLLVLVAVVGLVVVAIVTVSKKKRPAPVETDSAEVQRIQERLASSRIARRASGSRRKVVAIRPPAAEESAPAEPTVPASTSSTDTEKLPVADSSRAESEDVAGH